MNPIGYREFWKDTLALVTDLHMKTAIIDSLIDDAEDAKERAELIEEGKIYLAQARTLIDVLHSLEHYKEIGHLFPPFS